MLYMQVRFNIKEVCVISKVWNIAE